MKQKAWLGLILVALFSADFSSAQGLATLPYRQMLRIAQGDEEQKPDVESYKLKIASMIGDVPPNKIRLVIDSKDSPIHLIVDDKGQFEVPNTLDLYEENPLIRSNQPRGTLNMTVTISTPPFKAPKVVAGKIKYQDLFAPISKMTAQVRKIQPTFGLLGNDQFALKIETDQPIKIKRKLGARVYQPKKENKEGKLVDTKPKEKGVIMLILEAFYFDEDAEVEIPDPKAEMNAVPVSAKKSEMIKASW